MAIKQIKLDEWNGLNNIRNSKGKKPIIEQNTCVEVSYQGFLIDLEVKTLLIPPTNKYIGTITAVPAGKEKYDGLINIGDQMFFEEKNVRTIP